jgi:parallel beta-helix repeat protein
MNNDEHSSPTIANCTFSGNTASENGGGIYNVMSDSTIYNSILHGNEAPNGPEIYLISTSNLWLDYSDVHGGQAAAYVAPGCTLNWGLGNINTDPCFVDPANGDYHLKSEGWRWDSKRSRWTYDNVTSRCIDAGNPGSSLRDELLSVPDDPDNVWGQNLRIDMGAFGGTAEASIPPYDWAILGDLTNDGLIDLTDFAFQALNWLNSADQQPGDLNRDGIVDTADLALLVEDWLEQTSWH